LSGSAAENFKKRSDRFLRIPEKLTNIIELSKKSPARLPDFSKNVYQSYRTFQKISGNVTGLFEKNKGQINTFPHLILQGTLPDFSEKTRQGYRTFLKKFTKVTGLF
jgi:hypothetical protein